MSTITIANTTKVERQAAPTRIAILKAIAQELASIHSWTEPPSFPAYASSAAESTHKAEAMMNLLEEADCGSHGGFDPECAQAGDLTFSERFIWLVMKYRQEDELENWEQLLQWFPPRQPITRRERD